MIKKIYVFTVVSFACVKKESKLFARRFLYLSPRMDAKKQPIARIGCLSDYCAVAMNSLSASFGWKPIVFETG